MKNLVLTLTAATLLSVPAAAEIQLPDFNPVTVNFDNLNTDFGGAYNATGGTSPFPTASDPAGTNPVNVYVGASSPTVVVSNDDFNPGGVYSNTATYSNSNGFRALQDGSSSDFALGVKDSTDRTFVLRLQNATGAPVSGFSLSYNVEQYSTGASATVIRLDYSLDGSAFTTGNLTGGADVAAQTSTGADGNLASVLSTNRTAFINENVADSAEIFLRWTYDHQSGTSSHVGLDDISVAAVPEPGALIAGVFGAGILALRRRRS